MSAAVNMHGDNRKYQRFDWAGIAALSTASWNVQRYLNNTTSSSFLFKKKKKRFNALQSVKKVKKKILSSVITGMKLF